MMSRLMEMLNRRNGWAWGRCLGSAGHSHQVGMKSYGQIHGVGHYPRRIGVGLRGKEGEKRDDTDKLTFK